MVRWLHEAMGWVFGSNSKSTKGQNPRKVNWVHQKGSCSIQSSTHRSSSKLLGPGITGSRKVHEGTRSSIQLLRSTSLFDRMGGQKVRHQSTLVVLWSSVPVKKVSPTQKRRLKQLLNQRKFTFYSSSQLANCNRANGESKIKFFLNQWELCQSKNFEPIDVCCFGSADTRTDWQMAFWFIFLPLV